MSIAVDNACNIGMDAPGFTRGRLGAVVTSSVFEPPVERREEMAEGRSPSSLTTSSTSSIGKDSDLSGGGEDGLDENEVQSAYKGTLDSMEGLEEVLPIRRGMSKFYNGKSKSFTILSDASSSPSIKDIAKPENAFTRKRRNLLAFSHFWEKNRGFPHRNGISKRPISSSKSTLALAVAMSSSESISSTSEDSNSTSTSISKSPPHLPPLHPRSRASHNNLASFPSPRQSFSPWWSFSLADLQQCSTWWNLVNPFPDSFRVVQFLIHSSFPFRNKAPLFYDWSRACFSQLLCLVLKWWVDQPTRLFCWTEKRRTRHYSRRSRKINARASTKKFETGIKKCAKSWACAESSSLPLPI